MLDNRTNYNKPIVKIIHCEIKTELMDAVYKHLRAGCFLCYKIQQMATI